MVYLLPELTVIIPTKDDHYRIEDNIVHLINFLKKNIEQFEILIISNGSSLFSTQYIDKLILEIENVRHMKIDKSGKGLAVKFGINKSKYTNVLYCDADLSVDISQISKFVNNRALLSGFVVGNRKNKMSENLQSPIVRRLSGFFYLKMIKKLFNLNYEDTQCGFKAIDKNIFTNCNKYQTEGFSFDLELFLLARKKNITISEVPVVYIHNKNSKVKIIKDTFLMIKEVLKIYKQISSYEKNDK